VVTRPSSRRALERLLKSKRAKRRLNLSVVEFYRSKFDAAVRERRGWDIVRDLERFVRVAPRIA
jgi:hypothetical protein